MPMLTIRRLLTIAAFVLAIHPVSAAAQDATTAIEVSGKWNFSVTTDAGTGTPTVTFTQKGDSLTGHYSSQTLGEADLKGTIKDNKITFSFRIDAQGNMLTVTYTGTVESATSMKGRLNLGGMASGTFTAKKASS
jgi:hypothetical protein